MAEYLARIIELSEGQRPVVVHSSIPNAERRIASFRTNGSKRWLVSVGMVSEGVDIPRLRVLVYLPAAGTELAFRQAIGRVVRNVGHKDCSRAYVVMPALATFEEYARRIEDDLPSPGSRIGPQPTEKNCRVCGGANPVGERECAHCGSEFAGRSPLFTTCECGAFNRMSDPRCNNCGLDLTSRFKITLAEAARNGVISRGVDVPEEEVVQAERLAPVHRSMIERVERENQVFARILRTVPVELMPSFLKLVSDESTRERDNPYEGPLSSGPLPTDPRV
jgi:hypothetical protein